MKRVMSSLTLAASLCLSATASQAATVHYWYHLDNADNTMSDLISKFEKANPGIKIDAENIPWNSYYDNLYTSLVGGNAPDAAMVKSFALPRLQEMEVLEPLDDYISKWSGKSDLLENTVDIARGGMDKTAAAGCRFADAAGDYVGGRWRQHHRGTGQPDRRALA